jgi:hypothetical protein
MTPPYIGVCKSVRQTIILYLIAKTGKGHGLSRFSMFALFSESLTL